MTLAPASLCGCAARPHRRCDLCPGEAFLACSLGCLQVHLRAAHPDQASESTLRRARRYQQDVNRTGAGFAAYANHRARLTRLLTAVQRADGLCVLGAGNCDDLDLEPLIRTFGHIHLVDVDAEALERGRARLPAHVRDRVVPHAPCDLSGFIDHLDDWGDDLPPQGVLAARGRDVAREIAARIGQTFDVVVSACALSQLAHPFQNSWALTGGEWQRLFDTITDVHLATLIALTRPGGTGVIACDVLSHAGPALREILDRTPRAALAEVLAEAVRSGRLPANPDPHTLARRLEEGASGPSIERGPVRVHVTEPWLWDLGPTVQLVYGIWFRRL
jgi:hypothetical protein